VSDPSGLGRVLILVGALLILAGLGVSLLGRLPWIGRLPGDIVWHRGDSVFYFPITTCLLASALLSLAFSLLRR
jgi:hypothetical protein